MPTLRVFIQNFSGETVVSTQGDHYPRRDIKASGYCNITAELKFQPDHIWFWIDSQEGEDYKANIEIKWEERNLVLFRLRSDDGVKGDFARVSSRNFKGHIDPLPSPVREVFADRNKSDAIYHVDDFAF